MRVPEISEVWDGPNATKQIEFEIRRRIYCDLKDVAIDTKNWKVKNRDDKTGKVISESQLLPDEWGAEVTISLQVDEASALNPGIAFNTPLHAGVTNFAGEFETASTDGVGNANLSFCHHSTVLQSWSWRNAFLNRNED